jgi:DNA-binding transcriptional regulator/RsmH inhibitor MraZ
MAEGVLIDAQTTAPAIRFTGRYPAKVDAKGRISIPGDFRAKLAAPSVFVFRHFSEPLLQMGPPSLLDDLLAAVAGQDVYDEDRWLLEDEITEGTQELAIDETGRVSLPKDLRAEIGLEGAALFGGRGRHFVLGSEEYLARARTRAREAAGRHRDTLKARMLPSVQAGRQS